MNYTTEALIVYCTTPAVKRAVQLIAIDRGYAWDADRGFFQPWPPRVGIVRHASSNCRYLRLRKSSKTISGHRDVDLAQTFLSTTAEVTREPSLTDLVLWLDTLAAT